MATLATRHIAIAIERPLTEVYDFLKDPAHFGLWAAGLGEGFEQVEGALWRAATPLGPMRIRFSDDNPYGVLDHSLIPESGPEMANPMRVIASGDGCEVVFTLQRRDGMSQDEYERDAAMVAADLVRLKRLLERPETLLDDAPIAG